MYAEFETNLSQPLPRHGRKILNYLAPRITTGTLTLTLPNGEEATYRGADQHPLADIRINRMRAFRRLLTGGSIGLASSYIDGDWETGDLVAFLELAARNQAKWGKAIEGRGWVRALHRAFHRFRPNSKRGARRNISAHYDLGNAFYRLWLDPTLTYSAGLFESADDALETAQARKYARMARIADLKPGHEVLEIGCGWGGFSIWAARNIGCRVTAITISRRQYDYVTEKVAELGLADRIDVRLQDYRDVRERFDRVISIEMFEAVGERYWSVYLNTLRERLVRGGRAALQVITIDDAIFPTYRNRADFIQRFVFPGGMLPSPRVLKTAVENAGLKWDAASEHGADYARTLAKWHTRFERAWPEIAALGFDERFRRLWRFYLAYCEAGFRTERIGLKQIALSKP